jgi:hypothetical protein
MNALPTTSCASGPMGTGLSVARAYAELSETVELDGKPMRTPEVLVFELNSDGRIARVDVFIQTPEG